MKTNSKEWGEANRVAERKEFAGKAQMPEVLRRNLNILASGSLNGFFRCCYLRK